MKSLFLVIVFSTISSIIFSQKHFLKYQGGINWSNINSSIFKNTNYNLGYNTGLCYEYQTKKIYSFGIDVLYFQNGFQNKIIFTDQFGNPIDEGLTFYYNFNYITIPIKAGLYFGDKISGFANIGLTPSFIVNAYSIYPPLGHPPIEQYSSLTNRVNKFDIGGLVEFGGSIKLTQSFSIYTSLAYSQSFRTMTNPDFFNNERIYNYSFSASMGIKFSIN